VFAVDDTTAAEQSTLLGKDIKKQK